MTTQAQQIKQLQDAAAISAAQIAALTAIISSGPLITQDPARGAVGINSPFKPGTDPAIGGGIIDFAIPLSVYPFILPDGRQGAAGAIFHNAGDPTLVGFPEWNFAFNEGSFVNPLPVRPGACIANLCFIALLKSGWNGSANISAMTDENGGVSICIATEHALFTLSSIGVLTLDFDGKEVMRFPPLPASIAADAKAKVAVAERWAAHRERQMRIRAKLARANAALAKAAAKKAAKPARRKAR